VLILVVGVFNVVWGFAALDKKELFVEGNLVYSNLEFWGWFFIIIGALQLLTAILLFGRRPGGAVLAVIGASVSAMMGFFSLLANSDWALAIIALDILVLWSILAHMDDFDLE
jgi:hypothetical protein